MSVFEDRPLKREFWCRGTCKSLSTKGEHESEISNIIQGRQRLETHEVVQKHEGIKKGEKNLLRISKEFNGQTPMVKDSLPVVYLFQSASILFHSNRFYENYSFTSFGILIQPFLTRCVSVLVCDFGLPSQISWSNEFFVISPFKPTSLCSFMFSTFFIPTFLVSKLLYYIWFPTTSLKP